MGTRLNVESEDHIHVYFSDNKFYAYCDYDEVKNSFDYLYEHIVDKKGYDSPEELYYGYFCIVPCTDEYILSFDEFKHFAELYIEDAYNFHGEQLADHYKIKENLQEMINVPGKKIVDWS